ncbi:hypothetical protein HMPREF9062_0590 [Actinomyces sp. oral taxon 448 str. F0400]|nr:hypothetical protein HMPREF9062_0590 [Actinomyces sp. oral taxon 448 str. F0400]
MVQLVRAEPLRPHTAMVGGGRGRYGPNRAGRPERPGLRRGMRGGAAGGACVSRAARRRHARRGARHAGVVIPHTHMSGRGERRNRAESTHRWDR